MKRECTRCGRPFTPPDLARTESKNMEADRKAAGLEGVRFLYYRCPCGTDDIFVDILPRPDEPAEAFDRRREEMEAVVREMHADHVQARVVPVQKAG
jgi:hypothetical protein